MSILLNKGTQKYQSKLSSCHFFPVDVADVYNFETTSLNEVFNDLSYKQKPSFQKKNPIQNPSGLPIGFFQNAFSFNGLYDYFHLRLEITFCAI